MSELTSEGYQELYPKTLGSQIEGTVAEASHSLTADKANIADLNWVSLFENTYNIPSVTKSNSYYLAIAENSFSVTPLFNCNLLNISYIISGLSFYNDSGYGATSLRFKVPFFNSLNAIYNNNYGNWWRYPDFQVGYYGKLNAINSSISNTSIDYYCLYFQDAYSDRLVEIRANPNTLVNEQQNGSFEINENDAQSSAFTLKLSIKYVPN